MILIIAMVSALAPAHAQKQFLINPGFQGLNPDGTFTGWTHFVWHGQGRVTPTDVTVNGAKAAMIANVGPAKQAIFQSISLPRCGYKLTTTMAASELLPGEWGQAASIVIVYANGRTIARNVYKSDSDWRRVEVTFGVPEPQDVIVYFFNYGSGAVFVANPKLEALDDCGQPADGFSVAQNVEAPLNFEPPIAIEDTLLAGYCRDPQFGAREVCKRLGAADLTAFRANAPKDPLVIKGLARNSNARTWSGAVDAALKQYPGALVVEPDQYLRADVRSGLAGDWRGYDRLSFSVINPTSAPQPLSLEVWDDKTTGYWTRVNWSAYAVPGRSELEMPLQVFVGEKSTIGDRARLNLAAITKLVFAGSQTHLLIDRVQLEQEPADTTTFPELIALDAGPPSGPVMSGFIPLTAATVYRKARGWGLAPGTVIAKAEDRRHPGDLYRDWISFSRGGLDFELPDGAYHVWMVVEDPGYWEYYPSWRSRKISAQGMIVHDEKRSAAGFFANYYRHANDEDWPGDDIWGRYVKPRYQPIEFQAMVTDGKLQLRFDGENDPYATTLSALVIYPAAKSAQGEQFLAHLNERLKVQFDAEYRQLIVPAPAEARPAANGLDGKLWTFSRSSAVDVGPTEWPTLPEMAQPLSVTVARGEFAPLTVGLHVAEDLDLEAVEITLPGLTVTPYRVRNKLKRVTMDGSVYANVPRILDPLEVSAANPLHMKAGRSTRLWLEVEAPLSATPGPQSGVLTLRFAGGRTQTLAVTAQVLPWSLPAADVPIGYLGIAPSYPETSYPEVAAKRLKETLLMVKLLHRYAMTAAAGGTGPIHFNGYTDGRAGLELSKLGLSMELIKPHFAGEVTTYGGLNIEGLQLAPPQDTQAAFHKPFEAVLSDILREIAVKTSQIKGLPLLHVLGDEPGEDAIAGVVAAANAFKRADPKSRTAVFTSLLDPRKDAARELAGPVTKLYVNAHSEAGIKYIQQHGSECSLYNRESRYDRGVYLFKIRQLGCLGHMQFATSVVHADPWYGLDGREDEYAAAWTHPDGRLRPTLDLARYHEAITDYRTLLALEQAIARAPPGEPGNAAANWLRDIEDAIAIGSDRPHAWTEDGLDKIRDAANGHLRALGAAYGYGSGK